MDRPSDTDLPPNKRRKVTEEQSIANTDPTISSSSTEHMRQDNKCNEDRTRFNLRKSDLVRVIVQALESLDYHDSAKMLEQESGFGLHSQEIAQFRSDVLQGNWDQVLASLHVLHITDVEKEKSVRFLINRQKYLEQLEKKSIKEALHTLRKEISPIARDPVQLHKLASLIMCLNQDDLQERAKWDGARGRSRRELIDDLHKYIPPALMVPENRLEKLLLQAIEYQKETCLIGSDGDDSSLSLLQEQSTSSVIPQETLYILEHHTDEVWYVQFSHDGKYMVTTSADKTALLYEVSKLSMSQYRPQTLHGHNAAVSYASFSPDNSLLLTCSNDKTVKLWNISRAECLHTFTKHKDAVSAAVWMPDGKQFLTAGNGIDKSIRRWSSETYELIDTWKMTYKIHDIALTRDGSHLVVISHHKKIHVYDPLDRHQSFTLVENEFLTSLNISPDNRYILCSISREEESGKGGVHMWDLKEKRMVREFNGHAQTKYVLRATFGGKNSPFVISGSEDCKIYIWERSTNKLVKTLEGHVSTVNCVAWNQGHPHMLASASDDSTVRIWSAR